MMGGGVMDELEAVDEAKKLLSRSEEQGNSLAVIDVQVLRALLARAMRPHD
jgi:hypothetical protein